MPPPRRRPFPLFSPLASLLIIVLAVGLLLTTCSGPDEPKPAPADKATVIVPDVIATDGPDADTKLDDPVKISAKAKEVAARAAETPEQFDLSGDLRGDDDTPVGQREGPLATPNTPGCETRFLPTNYSNRTSSVRAIGDHYTAGLNRPGKSDMDGLFAYASSRAAGVSWHYLIDAEGHCYYMVPLAKKAWTIGNLNSQTVNIEVVGTGRESTYPSGAAGRAKLAQVHRHIAKVYDLPVQLGAVSNCVVTRPGIITHWMGGSCAGSHSDIRPFSLDVVIRFAQQSSAPTSAVSLKLLTRTERRAADCLIRQRKIAARNGGWSRIAPSHLADATACKQTLRMRNVLLHIAGEEKRVANRPTRHRTIHAVLKG